MRETRRSLSAIFLAVNYKSSVRILEILRSVQQLSESENVGFVIVDNLAVEHIVERIRSAVKGVSGAELLESSENRGYFGGARFAFNHYMTQGHSLPDWVIVCNNDILVEDKDFLAKLFRLDPKSAGVVAPRILVPPGNLNQNPFMRSRPSWLRWARLRLVSSNYVLAVLWDWLWRRKSAFKSWLAAMRKKSDSSEYAKREFIYAPHGSFIIFSRRFFEAGGYLDENLFLYGEEISVAEMCRSLNLPVIYDPALRVVHNEHQSTGKVLSRFTFECQKKAMKYVTSRYLSRSLGPVSSCQPHLR